MSIGTDLREREEQAANEADDLNPGQKNYDKSFSRSKSDDSQDGDQENSGSDDFENYNYNKPGTQKRTDSHGDTVNSNYNADDGAGSDKNIRSAKDKEERGSSLYSKSSAASAMTGGMAGIAGKLNGKGKGPTSGVVGLILFAMVGIMGGSAGLAGTLLVNMKEIFHNDRSDASRTNRLYSRAFLANKFKKDNGNACQKSKIVCKMSTMSKQDIKTYQENGFKIEGSEIDADGNNTGKRVEDDKSLRPGATADSANPDNPGDAHDPKARVSLERVTYPDGKQVTNGKEYYAHADKNTSALRSAEKAFPSRSSFYLNKFFTNKVLGGDRWGFTKDKKKFPESNKNGEQDRAIDEQTGSENGRGSYDPNAPPEERNRNYEGTRDGIIEESSRHAQSSGKGGIAGTVFQMACTPYRAANGIVNAVKLYQITRLGLFFLTFVQAADEVKDGRGDGAKVAKLSDNLTYYEPNEKMLRDDKALNVKAGDPNPKYNLSATDSQGYKTAAHGDVSALTAFAQNYILGGGQQSALIATTAGIKMGYESAARSVSGLTGSDMSGRQAMKKFCRSVNNPLVQGATCFTLLAATNITPATVATGGVCACIAEQISDSGGLLSGVPIIGGFSDSITQAGRDILMPKGVMDAIGDICGWVTDKIGEVIKAVVKQILESDDIKKLIEETLALYDANSDTKGVDAGNAIAAGAGLVLSTAATGYGNKPGNKKEIDNYITYTQPLEDTYIALEKADAAENPFDINNKYSLVGSLARAVNTKDMTPTSLYGNVATLSSLLPAAFRSVTAGPSANALYNQPSTAAGGESGRYDRCKDEDLASIGAAGDSYCSIVGVVSKDELTKASSAASNPNDTMINDLTEWMSTEQPETADSAGIGETCVLLNGEDDTGCEKSKQASINKDTGAPIEDSQYAKYLKYCTETRENPWGAQAEPYEQGTERDQRWYSGQECMSDSTMVKNFRMWTNFCLQSGTRDGTSDCYTEDEAVENDTEGSLAECAEGGGTEAIYTCALKYDNYGYVMGGGHGDVANAQEWIKEFKSSPPTEWKPLLDCSGLVRMAFVEAMGIEDAAYVAPGGYGSSKYWTKISLSEAKQGDIVTSSGHVAIVKANKGDTFEIFHASTDSAPKEDQILHGQQSYSSTIAAYRAKQ